MSSTVEIDGSYGEGGGQILRTALCLSAVTGKSTHVYKIRAGRKNPGLAPQHLTGVLAAGSISSADIRGAKIGSAEVIFAPKRLAPAESTLEIDVSDVTRGGSAGSVTLILQTILLPLALSGRPVELRMKGGTHVAWSPPFDYFSDVYLPALSRMGLDAGCSLDAWGFYPAGGGEVTVKIRGLRTGPVATSGSASSHGTLQPIGLVERGSLILVSGRAVVANLSNDIADRMARRATEILGEKGIDSEIGALRVRGKSTGAGIFLTARYCGALAGVSVLGKRGLPAERVALDACREFLSFHRAGASVDRHLADQLILPMSLASGRSEMSVERVTSHLLTSAHVIRQFVDAAITIEGEEGEPGRVVVDGI
jgi:RNA 3'-terminal phosphate cyclase (ATP)